MATAAKRAKIEERRGVIVSGMVPACLGTCGYRKEEMGGKDGCLRARAQDGCSISRPALSPDLPKKRQVGAVMEISHEK